MLGERKRLPLKEVAAVSLAGAGGRGLLLANILPVSMLAIDAGTSFWAPCFCNYNVHFNYKISFLSICKRNSSRANVTGKYR